HIVAVADGLDARLASAALQFPLGHPNVAAIIPGSRSPAEVTENREIFEADIPSDFWAELKAEGLVRAEAPTP
ncbi:MAG: aldo/keto reductase, partial [Pseudomonadota bacterium]